MLRSFFERFFGLSPADAHAIAMVFLFAIAIPVGLMIGGAIGVAAFHLICTSVGVY